MKVYKWLYFTGIAGILVTTTILSPVVNAEGMDWTGPYVGGHVGYGSNDLSGVFDSAGSVFPLEELDGDDFIAGGQVGYNFQRDHLVYGIEGSFSNSWLDESGDEDVIVPNTTEGNIHEFETEWFATVRGRVGLAHDEYLFYVTAGLAYVESEIRVEQDESNSTPDKLGIDTWGGAFGAGLEYSLPNNFSIKAEALYLLLDDSITLNRPDLNDSDTGDFIEIDDIVMFQIGVNYLF